jgi:integrase
MAITPYLQDGKKLYEVYVNGFDSRNRRVQRRKNGIETLRKAEVVEFELKRELAKLREEAVAYRWSEWYEEVLKRMKVTQRPSTIVNYDKQLKKWVSPRWADQELRKITKAHVHKLIFEELDQNLSPNTKRTILKMVRRVFQMALEEGLVDRNPCTGIQVKVPDTEAKVLTNAEAEIFLREARAANHRFLPAWFLALATGMRSGELMALGWTDLDFEARIISVSKQWSSRFGFAPTKTLRSRVVPISEDLALFLKELKLQRGSDPFVLPRLSEWEHGEQAKVTREFCVACGITPVKFHDLRATFITNLLSRGASLAQVMATVGHNQLKTTNGYLRKAGVEVKGVTDLLGYKLPEPNQQGRLLPFTKEVVGQK